MAAVLATGAAADGLASAEVYTVRGWIEWFDAAKGYSFFRCDDELPDVLLHVQCLRTSGVPTAHDGATVSAEIKRRPKGLAGDPHPRHGAGAVGTTSAASTSDEGGRTRVWLVRQGRPRNAGLIETPLKVSPFSKLQGYEPDSQDEADIEADMRADRCDWHVVLKP